MISPREAIDTINRRYGRHPGYRALHAKGIVCRGTFTASPEATALSIAPHLTGEPIDATIRFSNGAGNPNYPDYVSDVRGMAVQLHLPGGGVTNIVAQSSPYFMTRTPDAFIELVQAGDSSRSSAWRMPWFLLRHPSAIRQLRETARVLRPLPRSYAAVTYYAIHAFWWIASDGSRQAVRYTLVPDLDLGPIERDDAKALGRDYLQDDLRNRLDEGPLTYTLRLQVAEPGDATDDPMAVWPGDRRTVDAGTVTITEIDTSAEDDGVLVMDPTRVPDGIELSDDPILRYRAKAYSESVDRRLDLDA